ncbi:p115 like vesicle tethering protein [Rhodofomes roseus]|uniref:P115 like vesicle tethering protein n=1 Tax=Rhodofomes roseus TaxID=34475 RepID=A0ABQ8KBE9_9APHY|nr:p115 like vesicle tethering protein [Rhodofomes roseus]KAH9834186.1 p115 like vesicle tethering protein [Rhodofomes roseus]
MEFINQTYFALRGPQGAPQSAPETIARLADRLSPSTLLADRRAAVLSLKGLSRDHRADVGKYTLSGLIDVLLNDAEIDADIGKAVLETLNVLCEADDTASPHARELGFRHTDQVLKDEKVAHKLFALLADHSFYLRVSILQFLSTLLQNRRQVVQGYFLKAPVGPTSFVAVLEEKREIIRHEAIFDIQSLISQSPEIQKILAFEGAFERLFTIVTSEGGIEGGVVAHDALACIDGLLRYNQSNQSYMRNSPLPPILLSILGFPPALPHDQSPPQGFALQLWDVPQKRTNTAMAVGIVGLLARSGGGNMADPLAFAFSRCLIEIGLASNFPTSIKTQALRILPSNLSSFPFGQMMMTPYVPVPETNGEEWDRLEPASALDILVELILHGEYNGILEGERRTKEVLELRAAALGVFQNFVQREEIAEAIVQGMASPPESAPATPLLDALTAAHTTPLRISTVTATHMACLLFSHLLRASTHAKTLARSIVPPSAFSARAGGSFFVPADGGAPPPPPEEEPEQEEPQTLLQILSEHLSLAFLSRSREDTSDREAREWDRLLVGYLTLLSQWLWEDPQATRQFLEAGALGILVEPINQMSETDTLVPALCVFLLGVCYEFNREPGEITRSTIHSILTRLGVDMLVGRVIRLREDDRFKAIGPDTLVLTPPSAPSHLQAGPAAKPEVEEGEMWFDWAFVDFWKSNYYTVQKGLHADPNSLSSSPGMGETAMLVASLKDVIRNQAKEIDTLRAQLQELTAEAQKPDESEALRAEAARLAEEARAVEEKQREVEKEQEDLLVLLDELNSKRRRDKQRMREAAMEVSEDEGDDEEEEEEE